MDKGKGGKEVPRPHMGRMRDTLYYSHTWRAGTLKPIELSNFKRQKTEQNASKTKKHKIRIKRKVTRMWANAQRDGRPAEYRWRPLFNAAKFG